jgi:phosphatidylglycerophosphate synthase
VSDPASGSTIELLAELIEQLRTATEPVIVVAADLVVSAAAISPVAEDAFAGTSAMVVADRTGDLRVLHHQVVSAGTTFHTVGAPTHKSVGVLRISVADAPVAATALTTLREHLAHEEIVVAPIEFPELVLVTLVRNGVSVRAVGLVDVPWFRGARVDPDVLLRVDSVSVDRIRRLQANRIDDGFYSTFVVRKASKPLTRVALSLGLSPNTITVISFVVGIASAFAFAGGTFGWLLLGAVLLQLSLIIDCVDGEVARATRRFSALGAWLDASTDRVKEFAVYGGLAVGAARLGNDVWWLVLVLITLQTFRHMGDYDFARVQRLREAIVPVRSLLDPSDGTATSAGLSVATAMQASRSMNRSSIVRWAKKVIHMPIGERWLLISVVAVVAGPDWALIALLITGLIALGYVLVGRTLRTLTWHEPLVGSGVQFLREQIDLGPLGSAISSVFPEALRTRVISARWGWAIPALLRLLELGAVTVLMLQVFPDAEVIGYVWLFVVAYHHYDTLYRTLNGASVPRWIVWTGLGWDGRLIVVAGLALLAASASAFTTGLLVMAIALFILFVPVASAQWLRSNRVVGGEL